MSNEAHIRKIDPKYLVPRANPNYLDVGLLPLLRKLAWGTNLILKGPKGVGKTLAVEQFAAESGCPMLRLDCTQDTGSRDMLGSYTIEGEQVFFALGALTAAIETANEEGGCIVVLEEINTLEPGMQKVLNPVADYRQEVSMPKLGKVFRVKDGCKIWFIGTMNQKYGGTYLLNEDLRSRWNFIEVRYPTTAQERKILLAVYGDSPTASERGLVNNIMTVAGETRGNNDMGYALSPRDLVSFIETRILLDDDGLALKLLEGKYEGDKVKNFRARVKSTFNINLDAIKMYGV